MNKEQIWMSFLLSRREKVCLLYTLKGRSAAQIAKILLISTKTVESYMASVKAKLGCTNKSDLFDWAHQKGVLKLQENLLD